MTCRRAYELDLPAFVIDPSDPVWDDFRAHYPRCATCAAEVAAWTALQASLAERHPEPEELLRWTDLPDTLAADARASIARHVERCASCRDELRALEGLAANASRASTAASSTEVLAAAARQAADAQATSRPGASAATPVPAAPHHASAARAGGRHAERRPFKRDAAAPSGEHDRTQPGDGRASGGRGPMARVLLHPAFAYAVLVLVLLLPTVRAALDRDATRAAFDVATSEQAPAERQPITAASRPAQPERDQGAAPLDDAHVDRTAPRLVRQAPFRPLERAIAPAAREPVPHEEGGLAHHDATTAPTRGAGAGVRDTGSNAAAVSGRAPGVAAPLPAIRLLAREGAATRTLVISLPPAAAGAADVEIRVVDAQGGRELRQRVARAAGPGSDVQIALPAGFTAPVLQVEVYAGGAGPLLEGSVTP